MFSFYSVRIVWLCASVATALTFGSLPFDRGSPKQTVWPGRGGTVRDGGTYVGRKMEQDGWKC